MTVRIWSPEVRVNVTTAGTQSAPHITRLTNGNLVVSWIDAAGSGNTLARIFNAAGLPVTGELPISVGPGADTSTVVTALGNGGFAAFWQQGAIFFYQYYTAAGALDSGNYSVSNAANLSAVGQGAARGMTYVYADAGTDLVLIRHDDAGDIVGAAVPNTTTAGVQSRPDITRLADGRLVIAWSTDGVDVRARILTATLAASTPATDFQVNSTPVGMSTGMLTAVTALRDGGFVILWDQLNSTPGSSLDVRGRVFLPNGSPLGADFLVNTSLPGLQQLPEVVPLIDGGFLAVWHNSVTLDIRAQQFDALGQRVGGEALISTAGLASPIVKATVLADGRVAITWSASASLGDPDAGVHMIIVDPRDGLVNGTNDSDVLYGGEDADQIIGLAGSDTVYAQSGDDRVFAGLGEDMVFGFLGSDSLFGSDGGDLLNGGTGDDQMSGELGNDTLIGELGDDLLFGGDGADTLNGSAGQDALYGGFGDDVMLGENGDDAFFGDAGADVIYGGRDQDVLNGQDGGDTLLGELGDDLLEGGAGGDLLDGGAGVDNLSGGADGDVLIGGADGDRLEGGAGADIYWYQATTEGNDLIVGFVSADDQLRFTGSAFGFAPGATLTVGTNFIVGAGPTQATPTFYYAGGSLFFDPDGTGGQAPVFIALLQGAPALTAGDFQFI